MTFRMASTRFMHCFIPASNCSLGNKNRIAMIALFSYSNTHINLLAIQICFFIKILIIFRSTIRLFAALDFLSIRVTHCVTEFPVGLQWQFWYSKHWLTLFYFDSNVCRMRANYFLISIDVLEDFLLPMKQNMTERAPSHVSLAHGCNRMSLFEDCCANVILFNWISWMER